LLGQVLRGGRIDLHLDESDAAFVEPHVFVFDERLDDWEDFVAGATPRGREEGEERARAAGVQGDERAEFGRGADTVVGILR
jgi:hypothetical protein